MPYLVILLFVLSLAIPNAAMTSTSAAVRGMAEACGDAFCLTLTATSNAGAGTPDFVEITVPIPADLLTASTGSPCRVIPSNSTTRVFIGCELIVWQGHTASAVIRLTPVVYKVGVWIAPSAYVFDPVDPAPLVVAPILVSVPVFVYLPAIRR